VPHGRGGADGTARQPRRFAQDVARFLDLVAAQVVDGALLRDVRCHEDRLLPGRLDREERECQLVHVRAVVVAATAEKNTDRHGQSSWIESSNPDYRRWPRGRSTGRSGPGACLSLTGGGAGGMLVRIVRSSFNI